MPTRGPEKCAFYLAPQSSALSAHSGPHQRLTDQDIGFSRVNRDHSRLYRLVILVASSRVENVEFESLKSLELIPCNIAHDKAHTCVMLTPTSREQRRRRAQERRGATHIVALAKVLSDGGLVAPKPCPSRKTCFCEWVTLGLSRAQKEGLRAPELVASQIFFP